MAVSLRGVELLSPLLMLSVPKSFLVCFTNLPSLTPCLLWPPLSPIQICATHLRRPMIHLFLVIFSFLFPLLLIAIFTCFVLSTIFATLPRRPHPISSQHLRLCALTSFTSSSSSSSLSDSLPFNEAGFWSFPAERFAHVVFGLLGTPICTYYALFLHQFLIHS